MDVHWEPEAREDLQAIYDYLGRFSRQAADRVADQLTEASIRLARFPEAGREVPDYRDRHIRELIVGRYRLFYLVSATEIAILTVHPSAIPFPADD